MPTKKTEIATESDGFSAEERAAMKQRAEELRAEGKKGAKKADGLQAVLDAIAKMGPEDRALAERVHMTVTATAPELTPKTWYGMPAYANEEGGPANGVLTAVEDVLAEREDLELLRVPAIFGLGGVFPRAAPWADEVRAILGPFHEHPLLARMEANRIALFLRLIDPHRFHAGLDRAGGELLAAQQREIEALQGELSRLRLELAQAPATT